MTWVLTVASLMKIDGDFGGGAAVGDQAQGIGLAFRLSAPGRAPRSQIVREHGRAVPDEDARTAAQAIAAFGRLGNLGLRQTFAASALTRLATI